MTDDIVSELREQTKWLRFLAFPQVNKAIQENIKTKEQREIYQLSDGNNSTNDISKKLKSKGLKVSHMSVYRYWKKWASLGLVIPSEKYSGRFEKIINLDNFDIENK